MSSPWRGPRPGRATERLRPSGAPGVGRRVATVRRGTGPTSRGGHQGEHCDSAKRCSRRGCARPAGDPVKAGLIVGVSGGGHGVSSGGCRDATGASCTAESPRGARWCGTAGGEATSVRRWGGRRSGRPNGTALRQIGRRWRVEDVLRPVRGLTNTVSPMSAWCAGRCGRRSAPSCTQRGVPETWRPTRGPRPADHDGMPPSVGLTSRSPPGGSPLSHCIAALGAGRGDCSGQRDVQLGELRAARSAERS